LLTLPPDELSQRQQFEAGADRPRGVRVQLEEHVRAESEEDHPRRRHRPLRLGLHHPRPQRLQTGKLTEQNVVFASSRNSGQMNKYHSIFCRTSRFKKPVPWITFLWL
jgi:hypothetical protein